MFLIEKFYSFVHQDFNIDRGCFKLFYLVINSVLLFSAVLSLTNLYFGDPIVCDVPGKDPKLATQYCYTHGSSFINEDQQGSAYKCFVRSRENITINYYQWLNFVQIFQSAIFLLPFLLWRKLELGILQHILGDGKL